jgi:hypothetical protein
VITIAPGSATIKLAPVIPTPAVKKTERNKWFPTSWFDNNYEEFGYYFPTDGIDGWLDWHKDDETDIPNFTIAQQIADETLKELKPYQRERRGDFYASSYNHPILKNRESTLDMTSEQYSAVLANINFDDLFYKSVNEEYFTPLIAKLKNV